MKILLTGHKGQLGRTLLPLLEQAHVVVGIDLPEYDITDPQSIESAVTTGGPVEAVINAAAYTAVDKAESEPERAYAVNRDGAEVVAGVCRTHDIPLIHVSTDDVFEGLQTRPYLPTDPIKPQGVYGRSKAEGEARIRQTCDRHVIVRTSWLFGRHGNNFVKTMIRLGAERENLNIVDDQIGCPTYAGDLAGALLEIAEHVKRENGGWGTYHFCNQVPVTWYAFARRILALARPYVKLRIHEILPILTSQYPLPAPRG